MISSLFYKHFTTENNRALSCNQQGLLPHYLPEKFNYPKDLLEPYA
ncbi:hypothetical protein [Parabacteroides sp.]